MRYLVRIVIVSAALLGAGCSDNSVVAREDGCVPATCAERGAECGVILDGCGSFVECGGCVEPERCGGGGLNRCGVTTCQPRTCEALGAECGVVANDGCGSQLNCGSCEEGGRCGSRNRCERCVPEACDGRCGVVADGCGGTMECVCPEVGTRDARIQEAYAREAFTREARAREARTGELGARGVRTLPIPAAGLISDSKREKLYVSLPSTYGPEGNSVAIIDPATGKVERTVFVGSEPATLALSDNGKILYVGLEGSPLVVKVDVKAWSVVSEFDLGNDPSFGPLYAEQIAVLPGKPDSIVVSTKRKGVSPRHGGVGIWDGGVRREKMTRSHTGANRIVFAGSPPVLYGYNNSSTEFGFRTLAVKPDGIEEVSVTSGLVTGFGTEIKASAELIFSSAGQLIDPKGPRLLGSYPTRGAVESDPARGLIFVVGSTHPSSRPNVSIYSRDRFISLGEIELGAVFHQPKDLVRWGKRGLAFRTDKALVLVESDVIATAKAPSGR